MYTNALQSTNTRLFGQRLFSICLLHTYATHIETFLFLLFARKTYSFKFPKRFRLKVFSLLLLIIHTAHEDCSAAKRRNKHFFVYLYHNRVASKICMERNFAEHTAKLRAIQKKQHAIYHYVHACTFSFSPIFLCFIFLQLV